jgi:cytidylate kinase
MIITIDGPAASGKSSIAQVVAQRRGMYYLCSGMLYRACAYILHHYAGYTSDKAMQHPHKGDIVRYCNIYRITYTYTLHGVHILFDNHNITSFLKTPTIDHYASLFSAHPVVRAEILILQRAIAERHTELVADGRDMGSVAFPHAKYKFFLTASLEERAKRWQHAQKEQHNDVSLEEAMTAIAERDHRDTIRAHAPLTVPAGAITIDNTLLSLHETVQAIMQHLS